MTVNTETEFLQKVKKGEYGSPVPRQRSIPKHRAEQEHREIFIARCHQSIELIRDQNTDCGRWRWIARDGIAWFVTLRAGIIPIEINGNTTRQFLDPEQAVAFLADAAEAARCGELDALIRATRKRSGRRPTSSSEKR